MARRRQRYSAVAMLLHWAIAGLIVLNIALGWRMDGPRGPETFAVFQLHKSIGITVLLLTLLRILWRLTHRAPEFPTSIQPWEQMLARTVHFLFYAFLLGMPLTGWLIVSASKTNIPTLLFQIVPWPHVPGVATLGAAAKAGVHDAAESGHHIFALLGYVLILLHVLGALKHQFLDRGDEIARMLPAPRGVLSLMTAIVVALLFGVGVIGNKATLLPVAEPAPPAAEQPAAPPPARAPSPAPAAAPAPATPAAPPPQAEAAPASAAAGAPAVPVAWTVDKAASTLGFTSRWSEGPVNGRFDRWDARIRFHPDALGASSVRVTVDMMSARTGVPDTESALPDEDWFAARTHPQAVFSASRFRHLGGDRYEAHGTLQMRGVSRPLVLPFTLAIDGRTARMAGTASINRTLFGVGQGEWSATTEVPAIVAVAVRLTATAPAPITMKRSE